MEERVNMIRLKSLLNDKTLDHYKFKAFADDNITFAQMANFRLFKTERFGRQQLFPIR